jgi:hypothetical protein
MSALIRADDLTAQKIRPAVFAASKAGDDQKLKSLDKAPDFAPAAGLAQPGHAEQARLSAERAEIERRHIAEIARAVDAARASALSEFQHRQQTMFEALGKSLASSEELFRAQVAIAERLAAEMCEAALSSVFDDPSSYRSVVRSALKKQIDSLRADTIIKVVVSEDDFPPSVSLEGIAKGAALPAQTLERRSGMASGLCEIILVHGQIEISAPDFWQKLRSKLAEAAIASAGR